MELLRPRCRKQANRSKRKPGSQKGHPGHYRVPVEAERVSEVISVVPVRCGGCGKALAESARQNNQVGEPSKHQVVELPPIKARVIEYRCEKVGCPDCGHQTRAELPASIPITLASIGGNSTTDASRVRPPGCSAAPIPPMPSRSRRIEQVLGIRISLGCTQNCWEQVSEAVSDPYKELENQLKSEAVLNVDETGWRQNGEKLWIWEFVAQAFTFYIVARTRGVGVLESILGAAFQEPTYLATLQEIRSKDPDLKPEDALR